MWSKTRGDGRANGPNPYQPGAQPQVISTKNTMRAESPFHPPRINPTRGWDGLSALFHFPNGILGLRPRLVWFAPLALKRMSAKLCFGPGRRSGASGTSASPSWSLGTSLNWSLGESRWTGAHIRHGICTKPIVSASAPVSPYTPTTKRPSPPI